MKTYFEEAIALVALILFISTLYVWGQIIENRILKDRAEAKQALFAAQHCEPRASCRAR